MAFCARKDSTNEELLNKDAHIYTDMLMYVKNYDKLEGKFWEKNQFKYKFIFAFAIISVHIECKCETKDIWLVCMCVSSSHNRSNKHLNYKTMQNTLNDIL